jgi:hypothetical protein
MKISSIQSKQTSASLGKKRNEKKVSRCDGFSTKEGSTLVPRKATALEI